MKRSLLLISLLLPVALASAATSGTWRRLPAAPVSTDQLRTAVWTGKQMLVFGRHSITAKDARGNPYVVKTVNVAAAYDPSTYAWRRLSPPAGIGYSPSYAAAWTGRQMLVWGPFDALSYDPVTNRWRTLPRPPTNAGRLAVWTGKELGWGGGCCGDAFNDGAAFNPVTNTWRKLAPSPLAGSQGPLGAWTGRELVIFVGDLDPDGKPWPASLARAAAYNPATNTWRRIAPIPDARGGANVVWDGRDLLVVGGGTGGGKLLPRAAFAYQPATNRWRKLAPLPSGRFGDAAVWTGSRLLLWGGQTGRGGSFVATRTGLAYDPKTNRWTTLPQAPLAVPSSPAAVWTRHSLVVMGPAGGAAYTP